MENKLIEAVQMYPCLFDKSKRDYRNKKQKDEAWASVAEETGETGKHSAFIYYQRLVFCPRNVQCFGLFLPLLLLNL